MFNIAKKATKVKQQFAKKLEKKEQKGFSLIEIIIVVAIVLLLMVAFYRTMGRNYDRAKDADQKKDLKQIKIAFENYYNDVGSYPPEGSLDTCGSTDLAPYLPQVPCDRDDQPYLYLPVASVSGPSAGGYRVLAKLVMPDDPMIEQVGCPEGCGGIPAGLVSDPDAYNYGIAEGVPLRQAEASTIPTIDPADCSLDNPCYCCNNPPGDCNVFNGFPGTCNGSAFGNTEDCVNYTSCL